MRRITLRNGKKALAAGAGVLVVGAALIGISLSSASSPSPAAVLPAATTPIEHVVVIFPENISFDHYFGTYPNATNPAGEPQFHALAGTPGGQRSEQRAARRQPQRGQPQTARSARKR